MKKGVSLLQKNHLTLSQRISGVHTKILLNKYKKLRD